MKLEVTYDKDGEETVVSLAPTTDAIERAARKLGYQEMIPDPNAQRKIELKQAAILSLEPNDPNRAKLGGELQGLQQSAQQPVKNPVGKEAFIVGCVREILVGLLIDEQAAEQEGRKAAQQLVADQRASALTELGLAK